MKVNLKKFAQDKFALNYVYKKLHEQSAFKPLANKLKNVIKLMDEIETDLELGGECIVELDKPRLDSIQERDKMLLILKEGDDEI